MSALVGLGVTGILIHLHLHLHLHLLILGSTAVFSVEVLVPGLAFASPAAVLVSTAAWGPAFGASGSLQKQPSPTPPAQPLMPRNPFSSPA